MSINSNSLLLSDDFIKENLPKRKSDSNKNSFGRTLLVCGSENYPGAALLSSKAAAAIGSGLTALATPESVFFQITTGIPEIIHTKFNFESILEESKKSSVLVIGPGLGIDDKTKELIKQLVTGVDIPIVLDADGINAFQGEKELLLKVKNDLVITPHLKEFSRLLGISTEDIEKDKENLCSNTSINLNCNIVLKGAGTIISTKNKKIFISPFANSGLAKGGTGDVLAGFIGGLISQGLSAELASCLGVYIHGKCAEFITKDKTEYSLLPEDLINYLPKTLKYFL